MRRHRNVVAIRSVAALWPGFLLRLIAGLGRQRLTLVSISLGAAAFALLAVPSLPLMFLRSARSAWAGDRFDHNAFRHVDLAPVEARGTALSLRITGNRIGQVLVPCWRA